MSLSSQNMTEDDLKASISFSSFGEYNVFLLQETNGQNISRKVFYSNSKAKFEDYNRDMTIKKIRLTELNLETQRYEPLKNIDSNLRINGLFLTDFRDHHLYVLFRTNTTLQYCLLDEVSEPNECIIEPNVSFNSSV